MTHFRTWGAGPWGAVFLATVAVLVTFLVLPTGETKPTLAEQEQAVQALVLRYVAFPDGQSYRVLGTVVRRGEGYSALGCYALLQGQGRVPCTTVLEYAAAAD